MAFDKVVDSAKLDAGMTATANAIRGKTGGTDPIAWDESTGFKTAVEGITSGDVDSDTDEIVAALMNRTLKELHNQTATTISATRLCQNNRALEKVNLPMVTALDSYIFSTCSALVDVNLPRLTGMQMANFENCTALTELIFPSISSIGNNSNFQGCVCLQKVDFGRKEIQNKARFSQYSFRNCAALNVIILRAENYIWSLGSTNNFDGTPFAAGGTGGTVYVPEALIESYQTATNWSTLYAAGTCTFLPIEGSEYE